MGKKVREILNPKNGGQTGRYVDSQGRLRRTTVYRFPLLAEARERYRQYVGMDIEWPVEPKDWEPDLSL